MSLITTLAELDQYEDRLIQRFQQHPCFQQIQSLPKEQFHLLLLQRRFLSLAFTPVYDMVIDGIKESKARQIAGVPCLQTTNTATIRNMGKGHG